MPSEPLTPMEGPELVIGLVGAVGTDLDRVTERIRIELSKVQYHTELIRLSSLLHDLERFHDLPTTPEEDRYNKHMDAGNDLRRSLNRSDAMALLAVARIRELRRKKSGDEKIPVPKSAYLLRSLKHPEEVQTLRKIYGKGFIQFSVYSSRESRVHSLATAIAKSHSDSDNTRYRSKAEELVLRDESENPNVFGQDVRDAFPLGDIFVDSQDPKELNESLQRTVEIIFNHPFHTPTRVEYGIFHAKAAALRSADLSRQVGAVIMTPSGEIVSIGCNEVPKALGGLYWSDDAKDRRDFVLGYDSSAQSKVRIVSEILKILKSAGWLNTDKQKLKLDDLVAEAIGGGSSSPLGNTQVMNILEYGRIVHAEMAALTDAARIGSRVNGAIMYCTTFPCHMCARHIIAAGIRRVVYIEPYPKSLAAELYPDSITLDLAHSTDAVPFVPFVGIAPRRYLEFFEMPKRKTIDGKAISWTAKNALPRLQRLVPAYLEIESVAVSALKNALAENHIKPYESNTSV